MAPLFLLSGAGLLAGAMNAAAGGGSFVTIPALVAAGLPSVSANASSTVALLPGSLASAWAWRAEFRFLPGISLPVLLWISLAGGCAGAVLLLVTPQRQFDLLLPWLLLLGTVSFACGRQAGQALRRRVRVGTPAVIAAQIVLSVYAGYFGGGVGIMMMAVWSLLGEADIRAMSACRTLVVSTANLVAVLIFAAFGPVRWPETVVVLVAAVIGGYFGAQLARRLPPPVLRWLVISFSAVITILFFRRSYG